MGWLGGHDSKTVKKGRTVKAPLSRSAMAVRATGSTWRTSRAAGLTVRTLHHYDQIGLLCPSRRSVGGHRLYGGADARRLYQIVALRGLGLQFGQIRACLSAELDPRPLPCCPSTS
jgi:hypothetical protein